MNERINNGKVRNIFCQRNQGNSLSLKRLTYTIFHSHICDREIKDLTALKYYV